MVLTYNIIFFIFFCITNTWAHSEVEFESNEYEDDYDQTLVEYDGYVFFPVSQDNLGDPEKVHIQLYYECLCPSSIWFEVNSFSPVVKTMSSYLNIQTYPFGNAKIIDKNGKVEFRCQHGPAECYGNKLHACAKDKLENTTALLYNICLMNSTDGSRSDDKSADKCGRSMNIDSEPIKECAKGARGVELLQYYGEESKKAGFHYVPYVLINGKVFNGDDFKNAVCNAFSNPPPPCK